jgi:Zn-dependent protease
MMYAGFSFTIRRIPFRVSYWLFFTMVMVAIYRLQPLLERPLQSIYGFVELALAVAIVFIVHELGHCFAYRRYGHEPSVFLWGLGGITSGNGRLSPGREIVVALSGLASGMLLIWLPIYVLQNTLLSNWFPTDEVGRLAYMTLWDFRGLVLLWTLVNVLPIIPLDGGHICEAVLELVSGEPKPQLNRMISMVTAGVFAFVGFFIFGALGALFLGALLGAHNYLVWRHEKDPSAPRIELVPEGDRGDAYESRSSSRNVVSMDTARKKRDRRSPADLLEAGYGALERRDYVGAALMAEKLKDKRLNAGQASEATTLAAWAWLGQRNPVKAEEELATLGKGAQPLTPVAAVLALANKQTDRAVELMKRTLIDEPDSASKLISVDLFAEYGMIHRLARNLVDMPDGAGFEAAVALEGMLHRLHRTQDASTVSDVILLG